MSDRPLPTPTLETRPSLAIALGDPAGIGSEVVLRALADTTVGCDCNLTLVGNWRLLQRQLADGQTTLPDEPPRFSSGSVNWLDVPLEDDIQQQIQAGVENAASGEAGFRFLEAAIAHTLTGKAHGVVTAPISKSAWQAAGHDYPGQTELLAERAGVDRYGMLFVARSPHTGWTLRALLATTHIPLRQVPDTLTPELLTRKLDLLVECLHQDCGSSHCDRRTQPPQR
jgi:4-hydroxythreonine-4-phosphate dehydrogenase